MQEPKRPAKLPPPPRAELLKQQQEEEERRKAAAAAKLADIERRIAARQEAEAKVAAEAAAAEAAAQEQAAATAAEAGASEVLEAVEPAAQEATAAAIEPPAKPVAPAPEQVAPPNAWVKPLTLANGILDAEHATPVAAAADTAAPAPAEDLAVPPEPQAPAAPQASEPDLISLTSESLPTGGDAVAAAIIGSVAEPADAPRGQRPQRGRGRARAEHLHDPEQADRRVIAAIFAYFPVRMSFCLTQSLMPRFGVKPDSLHWCQACCSALGLSWQRAHSVSLMHCTDAQQARGSERAWLARQPPTQGRRSSAAGGRSRCAARRNGGDRGQGASVAAPPRRVCWRRAASWGQGSRGPADSCCRKGRTGGRRHAR